MWYRLWLFENTRMFIPICSCRTVVPGEIRYDGHAQKIRVDGHPRKIRVDGRPWEIRVDGRPVKPNTVLQVPNIFTYLI